MKYKMTIIKYDKNPYYEAEMAKWKAERGYVNAHFEEPNPEQVERSLEVVLTEEEYNKVKKAVLATFE